MVSRANRTKTSRIVRQPRPSKILAETTKPKKH